MTTSQQVGTGIAGHHHGEILQGVCTHAGSLVPCLITMPARGIGSRARYTRIPEQHLQVRPTWKAKAEQAARLTLEFLRKPSTGLLEIECSLTTGIGLGSSTSDVVAAIRAVGAAYDVRLDAGRVARIAVEAEQAADPIMFENEVVLFAQRGAKILESFGSWVPYFVVLSVNMDPALGGVETLSLPLPQYTDAELVTLESLIDSAREAFRSRDAGAIARVATASAELNQRFAPMRRFREICALAERHHALGVQISHAGTVAGILFDAEHTSLDNEVLARARAELHSAGVRPLGLFTTGAGNHT